MNAFFSLSRTAEILAEWKLPGDVTPNGLIILGASGETRVTVEQVDLTAMDGCRIREVVRVIHSLSALRDSITPEFAARWNVYAGLNALLAATAQEAPALYAKFPVYDGDTGAAEKLYPLLVATAAYHMVGVAHFLAPGEPSARTFIAGGKGPDTSFFGIDDVPARYGQAEFREACDWATKNNFFANHSETGLTVEFPWDEGATSALARRMGGANVPGDMPAEARRRERALAGETILVTLDTTVKHPLFGQGMLCLMRLPVTLRQPVSTSVVDDLNRWERNHADLVPTLGAWTVDTKLSGVAFACFIPGAFAYDFLPRHLTWWMAGRGWRVRQWFVNAGLARPVRLADR